MKCYKWLTLTLFTLCLCIGYNSYGQYYYYDDRYFDRDVVFEFGAGLGGMNCLTDISGSKSNSGFYLSEINPKNTRLNANFYVGALYQGFIGARLQVTYGNVQAYDSIAKGSTGAAGLRYLGRNANFRSTINEVALLTEFHPLLLKYYEAGVPRLSPYLLVGLGWFYFKPQTYLNGYWVDLAPLRTEGQGFAEFKDRHPYHLSQVNVPFGAGIRLELSPFFTLRGEFLYRSTFTDYLDDVSTTFIDPSLFNKYLSPGQAARAKAIYNRAPVLQAVNARRGDPKNKDSYMSLDLKLSMVLGRQKR